VTGRYVPHTLCEIVSDHGTVRPRRAVHMQHNGGTFQQTLGHTTGEDLGQVKPTHSKVKRADVSLEGQKSVPTSGDGSSTVAGGEPESVDSCAQNQPTDLGAVKETVAAAHVTAVAEDKVGDVSVQAGQEVGAAIALTSVEQAPELTMPSCMHDRKSAADNIKMQSLLGLDTNELHTGLYTAALPFIFESMPSLRPPAEPPPSS